MRTRQARGTKRNRSRTGLPRPLEELLPRLKARTMGLLAPGEAGEGRGPGPAGWTPMHALEGRKLAIEVLSSGADDPEVMDKLLRRMGLEVWGWMSEVVLELHFMGLAEDAISLCRRMLDVRRDEHLLFTLPMLLARAGRVEEAVSGLEANLKKHGDHPIMLMMAGDTYQIMGDRKSAEPLYRRALAVCAASSDPAEAPGLAEDLQARLKTLTEAQGGMA